MIGRNKVFKADIVLIQWANGKIEASDAPGVRPFRSHVGWYAETGQSDEFDRFVHETVKRPRIAIRHTRQSGAFQIVQHWDLGPVIRLFPLTKGPVAFSVAESISPSRIERTADAGIGIRWGQHDAGRSSMAIRGYVQIRRADSGDAEAGWVTYPHMVQIVARSRMTDALLQALIDHVRVCEVADSLIDRAKHPEEVACFEIALPLGPGQETAWGKDEISHVVPIVSNHPSRIDQKYLSTIWRPNEIAKQAIQDWSSVRDWAFTFVFGDARSSLSPEERPGDQDVAPSNGARQRSPQ